MVKEELLTHENGNNPCRITNYRSLLEKISVQNLQIKSINFGLTFQLDITKYFCPGACWKSVLKKAMRIKYSLSNRHFKQYRILFNTNFGETV